MTQKSILTFERIFYTPSWLIPPSSSSLASLLGIEPLLQLRFSVDNETFVFPDFDNIFSRPEAVKEWWFLPPEYECSPIWQDEEEWWKTLQPIYEKTILKRGESHKKIPYWFPFVSNELVFDLELNLASCFEFMAIDEENTDFSIYYYQKIFHEFHVEEYWRFWLWSKMTVSYYHHVFEPSLIDRPDTRKSARLSSRFAEYAGAFNHLTQVNDNLVERGTRDWQDKEKINDFFDRQKKDSDIQRKQFEKGIGEFAPLTWYQCRVCGGVELKNFEIKGKRKGGGRERQICDSSECEMAWECFRKSLPENPSDPELGNIRILQI
jgi:hypothetical protein